MFFIVRFIVLPLKYTYKYRLKNDVFIDQIELND